MMEKYGVTEIGAQHRAELARVRTELERRRSSKTGMTLSKEASGAIARLEERERELALALRDEADSREC